MASVLLVIAMTLTGINSASSRSGEKALHAEDTSGMEFGEIFCDSTLRIDYVFSGTATEQYIAVDKLNLLPGWYGKRQRLAELPVEGNGQITVKDKQTGKVLYRNSFSTLFQEWQSYDEAKASTRSFENVFLVPMPRQTVDITLDLKNNRRETTSTLTYTVDPKDILIRRIGFKSRTPYTVLQAAKDTAKCIHIAFVAEGYTEKEMDVFVKDAQEATDALFAHEPFRSMKERFNIIAVKSASAESGTSEPAKDVWKDTALGSHFDTFYSSRYLTTLNLKRLHDVLAGVPYEHIIVLVNTDEYGGGGILNSYNLSMTHHKLFRPVVVHEFGHSFAGLADEYAYESEAIPMYPHDIEPWEKNITTLKDFGKKWQNALPKGTEIPTKAVEGDNKIGVYEGAGYSVKGVYRAHPNCRMRTNTHPEFCSVCQEALRGIIDFYTK